MNRTRVSKEIQRRVRKAAGNHCGYCLNHQRYVMGIMEIEHIVPLASGGTNEESNLWLSCSLCNRYKGTQLSQADPEAGEVVALFNPRTQIWKEHFRWDAAGTRVVGQTPTGRATVKAMQLNNPIAVEVLAGWHPPKDV